MFTDYRPRIDVQLENQRTPMSSSYDYRQFLQSHAEKIVQQQRDGVFRRTYCGPCMQPYDIGTMLPEADFVVCDKVSCTTRPGFPGGIGTGRIYGTSPEQRVARDAFLTAQTRMQNELQSAGNANCCAPPANPYLERSGTTDRYSQEKGQNQNTRWAVPGGGRPSSLGDASVAFGFM